jgi:hypothetical protein
VKTLVDIGVYQYDDLDEAKKDADIASVDGHKSVYRHKSIMYVLKGSDGSFYGPMNEYKRNDFVWQNREVAYTANPFEQGVQQ